MVGLLVLISVFQMASTTTTTFAPIPEVKASQAPDPVIEQELLACDISVERCIVYYFPEDPKTALAVFKAESRLDPKAINYNCKYWKILANGSSTPYYTSCKKGDEYLAFSIDRGIAQVNSVHLKGRSPSVLFDAETNIKEARRIYLSAGWGQWSMYNNGGYKKYL